MNIKIISFLLSLVFLFIGCVSKPYLKENTALIVFKTPTFKYADMGFLYENKEEVKVEIYASGQALMSLVISDNLICMSLFKCMSKESFNAKVLNEIYPKDIMDSIFRGKRIFEGLGLVEKNNGFIQNITKKGKYNIHYSVLNDNIIFRDKMNNILVKIKKP